MKPDEMIRLFTKLSHHRRYIMVGVRVEIRVEIRDWETHEFYIFLQNIRVVFGSKSFLPWFEMHANPEFKFSIHNNF